ncbi:hypothetical protein EVAR_45024_1 [Eumeta japonica]|uniref:Uncharacterized protein n=1 Tax=Eumeta variegata TaxID=151549 RepID=A0A4C1YPY1_EUMVA|nr:hypothetical protein EVAR_45024_1 [Eumeta japonica]
MKVEKRLYKADSANLPKVDSFMIANFFASNPDFCSAEFRNVKTSVTVTGSRIGIKNGVVSRIENGTTMRMERELGLKWTKELRSKMNVESQ